MGFTTYIRPEVQQPALQEIIASLSGPQKVAVLTAYAESAKPGQVKHFIPIPKLAIERIFEEIDNIVFECRELMREEQLIEDAVLDPETGDVITPAVYNTAPADLTELKALVSTTYDEVLTEAQVGAVIDKMIEYTEIDSDGNYIGTWAVYAQEVVK